MLSHLSHQNFILLYNGYITTPTHQFLKIYFHNFGATSGTGATGGKEKNEVHKKRSTRQPCPIPTYAASVRPAPHALAPTTTTSTNPFNVPSCHSVDLAGFEADA